MLQYHDQEPRQPQREEYYKTRDSDPGYKAEELGHRP